jgi:hypothetical protein
MQYPIDVDKERRQAQAIYLEHSTPDLNLRIHTILDIANINPSIVHVDRILQDAKNEEEVVRAVLKYVINNGLLDYSVAWYGGLKRFINEFYYRYTSKHLIVKDTATTYKALFRLHSKLRLDFMLYNSENPIYEVKYYIVAQYSSRYQRKKGFLTRFTTNMFNFSSAYTNYANFRRNGFPPPILKPSLEYEYTTAVQRQKVKHSAYTLKDYEYEPFVNIAKPIIFNRLPKLKDRSQIWFKQYLGTLEQLIVREEFKGRNYFKLLLSIEYLRVEKESVTRV